MAELNQSPGKSGSKNRVKKMPVRVDLTAMVDLAFLLITFFMLTTSLTKPHIMPVAMPSDGKPGPVSEKQTITFCLGKNNHALWYMGMANHPLSQPQLVGYGKDMRKVILDNARLVLASTGKSLIVLVKPAEHSVYENLVNTLDELNITNVPTYAIAAISPKDIDLLKQKGIY
jgi:biopolymer transport protein ExbD